MALKSVSDQPYPAPTVPGFSQQRGWNLKESEISGGFSKSPFIVEESEVYIKLWHTEATNHFSKGWFLERPAEEVWATMDPEDVWSGFAAVGSMSPLAASAFAWRNPLTILQLSLD